jgi:hypothetical protein
MNRRKTMCYRGMGTSRPEVGDRSQICHSGRIFKGPLRRSIARRPPATAPPPARGGRARR